MTEHSELVELVKSAADIARVVKSYDPIVSSKVRYDSLQKARAHAKRCMGVQFALDQILKHMPASPDSIPSHATTICQKLSQKGIGPGMIELPLFRQRVLQKIKETIAPQEAAASK